MTTAQLIGVFATILVAGLYSTEVVLNIISRDTRKIPRTLVTIGVILSMLAVVFTGVKIIKGTAIRDISLGITLVMFLFAAILLFLQSKHPRKDA